MSMFPGPNAVVFYNEEGEPLGWDYPSEPDPYDDEPWGAHPIDDDESNDDTYAAYERGFTFARERLDNEDSLAFTDHYSADPYDNVSVVFGHWLLEEADGPDMSDVDECPEHGEQDVVRSESSGGPDPYNVNVLACGHRVMCFGPGEPNVITR